MDIVSYLIPTFFVPLQPRVHIVEHISGGFPRV